MSSTLEAVIDPKDIPFNVNEHYVVQDVIGEGAYGIVW
jgi:hypothetical protein